MSAAEWLGKRSSISCAARCLSVGVGKCRWVGAETLFAGGSSLSCSSSLMTEMESNCGDVS